MQEKTTYSVIFGILGAIASGVIGMLIFSVYGGNNCDQPPAMNCNCFCCALFNLRGYESCATFGGLAGVVVGAVIWITVSIIIGRSRWNRNR